MCDYTRVTSVQIFTGLKDLGRNPFVYALVVVVLVATVVLYCVRALAAARAGGHRVGAAKGVRAAAPAPAAAARRRAGGGDRSRPWSASPRFPTSAWCCWRSRATGTARSCRRASRWTTSAPRSAHDMVVPSIAQQPALRRRCRPPSTWSSGTAIAYLVSAHPLARRARARRRRDAAAGGARPGHGLRLPRDLARGAAAGVPQSDARSDGAAGHRLRRAPAAVRRAFARPPGSRQISDRARGGGGEPRAPARSRTFGASRCRCSAPHLLAGARVRLRALDARGRPTR